MSKAQRNIGKKYPNKKRNTLFSVTSLFYADYSKGKCPWGAMEKLALSPSLSPGNPLLSSSLECNNSFKNISNLDTKLWFWETQRWWVSILISYCEHEKPIFVQKYSIKKSSILWWKERKASLNKISLSPWSLCECCGDRGAGEYHRVHSMKLTPGHLLPQLHRAEWKSKVGIFSAEKTLSYSETLLLNRCRMLIVKIGTEFLWVAIPERCYLDKSFNLVSLRVDFRKEKKIILNYLHLLSAKWVRV